MAEAEKAFEDVQRDFGGCVKCEIHCSDCCHSVFGVFLIESAYISSQFGRLDRKYRREAIGRGDKADRGLLEVEKRIREHSDDPKMQALAMARERVRCPLLNDKHKCMLYHARPLTCRAYGIPTVINGKIHACWKAGFENGKKYPAFDLDGAYKELYRLSKKILERTGQKDMERASLLISIPKTISTPAEKIIKGLS